MEFVCSRCGRVAKQKLYRVTVEEAGVVMLNMLVCASCALVARELELNTVEIEHAPEAALSPISRD